MVFNNDDAFHYKAPESLEAYISEKTQFLSIQNALSYSLHSVCHALNVEHYQDLKKTFHYRIVVILGSIQEQIVCNWIGTKDARNCFVEFNDCEGLQAIDIVIQ